MFSQIFALVLLSLLSTLESASAFARNFPRQPSLLTRTSFGAVADATVESSSSSSSPAETLCLFSPCKINLFLRIIRKREDGFHDLASLFQAIGFGDTLELSRLEESDHIDNDEFSCNMAGVPKDSSNLVLRALQLMREKTGNTKTFFRANLIKQVPAQAGLGGGSANAATAMWGANELLGRPASLEQVSTGVFTLYSALS
jgi:4-diphosphocytidyl-2-C-methyl-D-erythritol kinase